MAAAADKADVRRAFREGLQISRLASHRQAITRAAIHAVILNAAIFAPVVITLKIVIGVAGFFVFGVVASRKQFRGRL